mgnify:CR=1 FL=1
MKLSQILTQTKIEFSVLNQINDLEFNDIALDSRLVTNSSIFFALQGQNQDGKKFIDDAVKNGAVAVVSNQVCDLKVPLILCENPFDLLVEFLQIFYFPLPSNIYAITGTNGKTSTAEFTRQILGFLGKKSASIGTLGIITDVKEFESNLSSSLTTPDIVVLYKNLYNLKKAQIDDVAIEVSSIGLEQQRIAGLKINVGAFTNFSQDHLDYHNSMEKYFDCKMILFNQTVGAQGFAVLNSDISEFAKIKEIGQKRNLQIIEYGFKAKDLKLLEILSNNFGQQILFEFRNEKYQFNLSVVGDFQAFNALCALANILAKYDLPKNDLENLLKNFDKLSAAAGRMQRVAVLENKAQIFVDFAHSPDALENVLNLARQITKARVIVLFGCGGNRDAKKRPIMGKIASELADFVIVTDDNPRNEEPSTIRAQILSACSPEKTIEIANRKVAIEKAIEMLQNDDVLILAGKGHEKYQIIGETKFDFDEEKIVKNVVAKSA